MASGGIGNQSPATIFQARLDTTTGIGNTLSLIRYQGNKVVVSGIPVIIPQTGIVLDIADNLIDASGDDAAAPPAASTLYYVYVSNRRSTFAPEEIRLSATAPSLKNGVKYLGLSGNAANWRFVGWVFTNATPEFESSDVNAYIVNYYNRLSKSIFATPGYDDTVDFENFAVPATGAWVVVNAGVDATIGFISNGEDDVKLRASAAGTAAGVGAGDFSVGLGIDGVLGSPVQTNTNQGAGVVSSITTPPYNPALAEGDHTVDLIMAATGSPATIYTTTAKYGAAVHAFLTLVEADVMV